MKISINIQATLLVNTNTNWLGVLSQAVMVIIQMYVHPWIYDAWTGILFLQEQFSICLSILVVPLMKLFQSFYPFSFISRGKLYGMHAIIYFCGVQ